MPPGQPDAAATVGGMTQFVALLRGVNVGGITVKSADLADMARGLGLDDVRTVLASGNLTFSSSGKAPPLKKRIEGGLRDRFGYDAWIVLTTADHLRDVIDAYPYPERDAYHPYVLFGSDPKVLDEIDKAAADLPDADERVTRGDGVVYWECPKGSSTVTPFAKLVAKPKYKSTTTTRNLRTLRKLL
jgi:uncharacterized protein (DUF1697 family)